MFQHAKLIVRIMKPDEHGEDIAGWAAVPFFAKFLKDIRSKLDSAEEAFGRQYQREIVNTGTLNVVSPITGSRTSASESFVISGRIFYRFLETEEFYVAAGRIKFGYPLIALFVPRANLLLKWEVENDKRGIEPKHVDQLITVVAEQAIQRPKIPTSRPVTILMGHKNFAHHLWNELPALERLIADMAPDRTARLVMNREPLGPIDRLFPELATWEIVRAGDRTKNGRGNVFVHLGSYCVTRSIRERLLIHARASASDRARRLEDEIGAVRGPVFWVSVRTQSPTPVNQRAMLVELGLRILKEFPVFVLLFDGFSLPEDWQQAEGDDIEFYRRAVQASKEEIDATIAAIAGERRPSEGQRFVNLAGWRILDSIATARLATCYFCHIGTVQHKIGWTTNVPGIIHANRRIILRKSPLWCSSSRVESGVLPEAISAKMVTPAGKEDDYEVLDTIGVAERVCRFFRFHAARSGVATPNRSRQLPSR